MYLQFEYTAVQIILIVTVGAAALLTAVLTPTARSVAYRIGAVDIPDGKRKLHSSATPRTGGAAIFAVFILLTLILCRSDGETLHIVWGCFFLFALGFADDIFSLPASFKFAIQTLCAVLAVAEGIRLQNMPTVISVIYIVAVTNAHNLTDGIDGLALGVSAVESIAIAAVCIANATGTAGKTLLSLPALLLCGCCMGMLPYNFAPASVFIGDGGAYLLGYTLSALFLSELSSFGAEALPCAMFLMFAYPLTDTAYSLLRRMFVRSNPFAPDHRHIHHLLSDRFGVRKTFFMLTASQAICCFVAVLLLLDLVT